MKPDFKSLAQSRKVVKMPDRTVMSGSSALFVLLLLLTGVRIMRAEDFKIVPEVTEAQLGDPFNVLLQASDPKFDASRISKIEFKLNPDEWQLAADWKPASNKNEKKSPGVTGLWTATLQGFDPGYRSLPPAQVYYKSADSSKGGASEATLADDWVTTSFITIRGVRDPNETKLDLAGLKPPVAFPPGWGWLWLAGLGALAVAALAYAFFRWRRNRRLRPAPIAPPEPQLLPGPWALREIERSLASPLCDEGPAKEVYSRAADVIRIYLSRRFILNAMEMTTYECMRCLSARLVEESRLRAIQSFLDECDLAKFSKFEPPREQWRVIWERARAIVMATTPSVEWGDAPMSELCADPAGAAP